MMELLGSAAVVLLLYMSEYEWWVCLLPVVAVIVGPTVFETVGKMFFGSAGTGKVVQQPKKKNEDEGKPKLTIVFASQTGTAELYAKTLGREAKKLGFKVAVEDSADFQYENLWEHKFVLFLVATYGEGEPTDTCKDFHEWLMNEDRAHDLSDLSSVDYAVFALGDSQYKHFCQMGIDFDQRLAELNAKRVHTMVKGDSDHNMEEDFDTWKADMWAKAAKIYGLEAKDEFAEAPEQQLKLKVHPPPKENPAPFPVTASSLPPSQKLPCWGVIATNTELLKNCTERSTKHIEIDCSATSLPNYDAGDHLGILPANSETLVDEYLKVLDLGTTPSDALVSLVASDGLSQRNHLPNKVNVRTALKWYFDLQGVPKKSVLRAFTHYTADPTEQAEFRDLLRINDESVQKYHTAVASARTVLGFLKRFPSTKVPVDHFFELMPRTQPRWYSIASDALMQKKVVHVCLAVSEGGLASQYLKGMEQGQKVPCFIRKSTFHLPNRDKTRPTIMIGPGTGVAPMIGFLHKRFAWVEKGNEVGRCRFYFGCRKQAEDHLYKDLMEKALKEGIISDLRVAYSREQDEKVYVQHLVKQDAKEIMELIGAGANIYICGDAKYMAKAVEEQLRDILITEGGMTEDQALERLNKMEKSQRFLKDVWTSH